MTKKAITKTTLAVSLDIAVAEKLKEIAKLEERSVSQMVQRALVQYIPTVENEVHDSEQKAIDCLINRLTAAVTTPEIRRQGIQPTEISLEDGGRVVIRLQPAGTQEDGQAGHSSQESSENAAGKPPVEASGLYEKRDATNNDQWAQMVAIDVS